MLLPCMVGDTENDMIFAKNAGAGGILISADNNAHKSKYPHLSSLQNVLVFRKG